MAPLDLLYAALSTESLAVAAAAETPLPNTPGWERRNFRVMLGYG
jgi:hypothetical protein